MNIHVQRVVNDADVVMEILDARDVEGTRCSELENAVAKSGKVLLFVVNKVDLADFHGRLPTPFVRVSAKERMGTKRLRDALHRVADELGKEIITVGVVGYANTGKSSLISTLKGRASAKSSPTAGFTRGAQVVKVSGRIRLIDSPGIIPRNESQTDLVLKGAFDVKRVKDAVGAALALIDRIGSESLVRTYTVESFEDSYMQLEELAGKWMMLRKGKELDLDRAARKLLRDWQAGKIK
ncbi:MAG: 50S ribosome-binding GTPase [Candidatus Diapherotrites archaeon]|nr:50S ribosome-binding GTPase [Candidatus Diapherotrites archaeon]